MTPAARRTTWIAAAVAAGMLGLGFSAKPLYDTFCRVTGFAGSTNRASEGATKVLERPMRIRFDAGADPAAPLRFYPVEPFLDVRVGETAITYFEVENTSGAPFEALATYNVSPHKAGRYFTKLECFCFEKKIFQPGQRMRMPVVFYIDPDIAKVASLDDVRTITLSYTYFKAEDGPGAGAS